MHDTVWRLTAEDQGTSDLEIFLMRDQRISPDEYLRLLGRMKENENWFSSMWTFQEGLLLNIDRVVDPRSNDLILCRDPEKCGILIDRNGETLKSDSFFRSGAATLLDITSRVTLNACDMVSKLTVASNDPNRTDAFLNLQQLLRQFNGEHRLSESQGSIIDRFDRKRIGFIHGRRASPNTRGE